MENVATSQRGSGVGLRELRANLSSYVAAVKAGHSYTLTEHGQPVARLVPVEERSNYERLIASGVIQPARDSVGVLDPPVVTSGTVSDLIGAQRR